MAVNLFPPEPSEIYSVPGVVLGVAAANIRKPNRNDVLVVELALGSRVAGVFTSNRFAAAPVQVCRTHLAETNNIRALVVNTGIANAGTGEQGLQDAQETCRKVADIFDCSPMQVLPFSTGVIMEPLPMNRLLKGVEEAAKHLSRTNWIAAAEAIMTTDTVPKCVSQRVMLDDDEIAEEIENMLDEAKFKLSKKGQAALDKMREEANADADVDDAGKYVNSFNDMAENDTDFDTKGFKSFVKEKGDARAIKALARKEDMVSAVLGAFRENKTRVQMTPPQ